MPYAGFILKLAFISQHNGSEIHPHWRKQLLGSGSGAVLVPHCCAGFLQLAVNGRYSVVCELLTAVASAPVEHGLNSCDVSA